MLPGEGASALPEIPARGLRPRSTSSLKGGEVDEDWDWLGSRSGCGHPED